MRFIGRIDEKTKARVFSHFLYAKGIENKLEAHADGGGDIWVHSEDHIDEAKAYLRRFLDDPGNPEFGVAAKDGLRLQKEEARMAARSRTRYIDVRTTWSRAVSRGVPLFTLILIIASVGVFLLMYLASERKVLSYLAITSLTFEGNYVAWPKGLPTALTGQFWRLFTPMFIHFTFIHILFNMLWLKDLGSLIEIRHGKWKYGFMVLVISGLSNLGQFWMSGPIFGGMSGVVYGLLGYIWARGKFDPSSGFHLDRLIVLMMGGWFILCLVGVIPGIANTAHGVGLGTGLAWGFLSSGRFRLSHRRGGWK